MPRNRLYLAGGILAFLLVANFIYYFIMGWGLITVKVHDVPLSKVIKSIEWQGWVKIYSNIDPTARVTMYVDHVSLPEALEALAINVEIPPSAQETTASPPASDGSNGNNPGRRNGGGGFGRGRVQWNLAFFAGSSSSQVRELIRSFEHGDTDDNLKTYNYPTLVNFLQTSTEDDAAPPVADPRQQNWPGLKAQVIPVSTAAAPAPDPAMPPQIGESAPPQQVPPGPPTSVQGYLRAFAQSADIFIVSNSSWDPPVANPPSADSSIISAIRNFVGSNHGSVTQAYVLATRGRGPRNDGGRRGGFAGDWDTAEDRVRNALNGLPEDVRNNALTQLNQEIKFRKDVEAAPPERRASMVEEHMKARMADNLNGGPMARMSPEKRAQRYQRAVENRMAAQGK